MNRLLILICSSLIALPCAGLGAHEMYSRYTHPEYGYTLLVPAGWEVRRTPGQYGDIVSFWKGTHSIRIEAMPVHASGQDHALNELYRRLHERTARLNQIVDNQPLRTAEGRPGTLQVYDYTSGAQHRLQRTLITNGTHVIYTIECSAASSSFYSLEKDFNRAMLSFSFNRDLVIRPAERHTARYTPSPAAPQTAPPTTGNQNRKDAQLPGLVPDTGNPPAPAKKDELGLIPDK